MLTLEENDWNLRAIKIYSALNVILVKVNENETEDGEGRKIRVLSGTHRQSNKLRIFLWRTLFSLGISHWTFMFARLIQSTLLEPEKYFRWDHFVIHFASVVGYAVFYYTAFRLFHTSCDEWVMVFNQFFVQPPNPPLLQKMMDEECRIKEVEDMESSKLDNPVVVQGKSAKSGKILKSVSSQRDVGAAKSKMPKKPGSGSRVCPRPLFTWPLQYSLDELLARTFSLVVFGMEVLVMLIFAVDPSRPQLLYSALPPEWQNPQSFLALLAVEAVFFVIIASACSLSVIVQLLFFSKCQLEFQRLNRQLRAVRQKLQSRPFQQRDTKGEIRTLRWIFQGLRELVLFIELFNRCFPFVIFAWKICSFSLSILSYFFAFRHYQEFPLLSIIATYLAIGITVIYTIMYGHAFSIPGEMAELKREFLLTAQRTASTSISISTRAHHGNQTFWPEMKREIGRIQNIGVKVGSFHTMERDSTPNFINFVVNQVVTLLVTIPP